MKKASRNKKTAEGKRAKPCKKPVEEKRAVGNKETILAKRATCDKKPSKAKRAVEPKKSDSTERAKLRAIVRGAYDIQKLRMQSGIRIVANWKARMGKQPNEKDSQMDSEAKQLLAAMRIAYKRLTDGLARWPRPTEFEGTELISDYTELTLVDQYVRLVEAEERQFKMLKHSIESHPLWGAFLEGVKGIDRAMAGVILSEIDIAKARHPSSLWKYAGLDVAPNGAGRSRKAEHLVDVEYKDRNGKQATRKGITFNPFLKTKLVGVLGSCFLRCNSPYREAYDNYRHRLEHSPAHQEKSKGHRHNMAIRYMVKMFLVDLHRVWRELEGLPAGVPYQEAKLGHVHAA